MTESRASNAACRFFIKRKTLCGGVIFTAKRRRNKHFP